MSSRRILIVEDDRDLAELMVLVLEGHGLMCTVAGDGARALEALEQHDYAAIVLDLMMPSMDGVEFRLRQLQHSSRWHTPVLVVSAHHNARHLAEHVRADEFVAKPFLPEDLVAALRRVLPEQAID
jgi:two-component system, OmpR family, response regulator